MDRLENFRQLAIEIWARERESIDAQHKKERERVIADASRRNILKSGIYFGNMLAVQKRWMRSICEALGTSYLRVLRESGTKLTKQLIDAIGEEVESIATRNAESLTTQLQDILRKSGGPDHDNWVKNNFEHERDIVVSQVRRNLRIELGLQELRSKANGETKSSELVFVIMPIRKDLDAVFEDAIIPALNHFNLRPYRVDKEEYDETIAKEILTRISNSQLVIADLTYERPNCYLEVGFAMGNNVKVILCAREDHDPRRPFRMPDDPKVHFDLDSRKITYWNPSAIGKLRDDLIGRIKLLLKETQSD